MQPENKAEKLGTDLAWEDRLEDRGNKGGQLPQEVAPGWERIKNVGTEQVLGGTRGFTFFCSQIYSHMQSRNSCMERKAGAKAHCEPPCEVAFMISL